MPAPRDKTGVKRFLGFVNYLSKFTKDLSAMIAPLRSLLRSDVMFSWDENHERCFQRIKSLLSKAPCLRFYDSSLELVIQVDASKDGLGAALLQMGIPVAYASRSLTKTEVNYSQIEKELLAVVFGFERFHAYTFGRQVLVESDHKPLESLLKKNIQNVPARLQRMAMRLWKYDAVLTYKPGREMVLADTLSRAPMPNSLASPDKISALNDPDAIESTMMKALKAETAKDATLQKVAEYMREGWPAKQRLAENAAPFFKYRDFLAGENGLVVYRGRAVVPQSLKNQVKKLVHLAHLGRDATIRRAKEAFFWPGMVTELEDWVASCTVCRTFDSSQKKEPILQHTKGNSPWEKVASDIFSRKGKSFLVVVDYFSFFIELVHLGRADLFQVSSETVIQKLKEVFARYGIPSELVSDNGPQYSSTSFREFSAAWGFHHTTSSPHYPQSNGMAERAVRQIKSLMKKCEHVGGDLDCFLLELRNTPREGFEKSSAEMLFGRQTKPLLRELIQPAGDNVISDQRKALDERAAYNYNKSARKKELKDLSIGEDVWVRSSLDGTWKNARVTGKAGPRSYWIKDENEKLFRRNRLQLKPRLEANREHREGSEQPKILSWNKPRVFHNRSLAGALPVQQNQGLYVTRAGRIVRPPVWYPG
jgi:transposase InsO family protein